MNSVFEDRAVMLARYIVENKTTVRKTAEKYGISKSTVHKDVSVRLKEIDPSLHNNVKQILELNKAQRHIRGGNATRNKYLMIKSLKSIE
ncbi:MAG: sporulation transcriptional regulator SpoIIID [Clostridiales bacterium]|nr:sporulation transcriptional regulator SpoIIID [Clostridiales bacterium]